MPVPLLLNLIMGFLKGSILDPLVFSIHMLSLGQIIARSFKTMACPTTVIRMTHSYMSLSDPVTAAV